MEHKLSATLELRDKFTAKIQKAGNAFDNFRKKAKTSGSAFTDTVNRMNIDSNKIKGIQKSMNSIAFKGFLGLATGTSAVGILLKKAYGTYVDLNEQLIRNAAITGANASEQKKMADQARYLGRTMKFTAKEVAEAQMYQAMAGYDTNQILEATPTLLKLSIASGEDLARTSDMVTDNLSALGLGVKDLGMYSDLLANMANRTNTNVSMLSDVFAKTGAVMRQVGKEDVREMATAFGLLADAGIKGAEAGTAVKSIYGRLAKSKDDKKMMALFEKYNIKLYKKGKNGKAEWKGLLRIIEEMKPKFEKMSAAEQNYFLTTVGGIHHMDAFGVLLKSNNEALEKARSAAYGSAGALDKFANRLKKADRYKIDELKSAWEGFLEKIGQGLSPMFIETMGKLTKYLSDLTDSNKLDPKNIEKFFKTTVRNAKIAAGAFLSAQIAFLAMRASMGDPTAIAQIGVLAAAGVGLGVYAGLKYSDTADDEYQEDRENKIEAYQQTDYAKTQKKVQNFNNAVTRYAKGASSNSYGAMQQANYQNAIQKAKEMSINVDLSGTVVKEMIDIDKVARQAGDMVSVKIGNELKTQMGLQQ